jgi:hypothetical protein
MHNPLRSQIQSALPVAKGSRTWLYGVLLLVLMAVATAIQCRTIGWTVSLDLKIYAIGARELLAGRALYADIWDIKPPGIWMVFMAIQWLFGYGTHQFFILLMACNILIMAGIYKAGIVGKFGPWAGLTGVLIWTLQCGDVNLELHNANAEYFINVLMVWSFVGMLSLVDNTSQRWVRYAVGLCWLGASLFKQSIIIGLIPLAVIYLVIRLRQKAFKQGLVDVLTWAGIGMIGWVCVLSYFAIRGHLDSAWAVFFTYAQIYGGNIFETLFDRTTFSFWLEWVSVFKQLILLFALNMVALLWLPQRSAGPQAAMLLGWAAFAYVNSFCLPDLFHHYFQYWIPVLSLGAGWGIVSLIKMPGHIPRWCAVVGALWFITGILFTQVPCWTGTQQQYDRSTIHRQLDAEARLVGRTLRQQVGPEDHVFLWGFRSEIIFTAGCRITSGVIEPSIAIVGPLSERLTNMIFQNIKDYPPKRVIICERWLNDEPTRQSHVITRWIHEHCRRLPESDAYPDFSLWVPIDKSEVVSPHGKDED